MNQESFNTFNIDEYKFINLQNRANALKQRSSEQID
jgi:hypothetical protein